MKNSLLVTGYLALTTWLVLMVLPTFRPPGWSIEVNGFSALLEGTPAAWVATLVLLGYSFFALRKANQREKS